MEQWIDMLAGLNKLHTMVWIFDIENFCIVWANEASLQFWGCPDLASLQDRDFKTDTLHAVKQGILDFQESFKSGKTFQEHWTFTPKHKEVQTLCQFSGIQLEDGRTGMLVEAVRIDDNYSKLYFNGSLIISTFAQSGEFISCNPSFVKEYGNKITALIQHFSHHTDYVHLCERLCEDNVFEGDVLLNNINGECWYKIYASASLDQSNKAIILFHYHNIDDRKRFELSLEKQASTDPLTELLNRRGMNNILERVIGQSVGNVVKPFSLFYIGLDGFKVINDAYGHSVGDKVLIQVAKRLTAHLDNHCEVARFGGDEFVLLIQNACSEVKLSVLSQKILNELSLPIPGLPIKSLSASIGSVRFPEDGATIDQLISRVDTAMYYAKRQGIREYMRYLPKMTQDLKRKSDISIKLASAIEENILTLYYQPIVNTEENRLVSFEALLRWFDDEWGYINPEEVIQIAEKTGQIEKLETWVLHRALSDLIYLRQLFSWKFTMSVNMSGLHLSRIGSAARVSASLAHFKLLPEDLNIELTESVLIDNIGNSECQVKELVKRGIKISLDDFGTGFSSLAYLHQLPASVLKVDKMFVDNISKHKVTLECIAKLSREFSMCGLVEGVESREQSLLLQEAGFHIQQGYWLGRPQPISYYDTMENRVMLKYYRGEEYVGKWMDVKNGKLSLPMSS